MKRSGHYVKNLSGSVQYFSFKPSPLLPKPKVSIDSDLSKKINKAYRIIGKLDGVSDVLLDQNLFISMYVRKEALLSCQIEGTQATLDDVFDPYVQSNKDEDLEAVIRYLEALNKVDALLSELPVSVRLIKTLHESMMEGTRGQERTRKRLKQADPEGSIA